MAAAKEVARKTRIAGIDPMIPVPPCCPSSANSSRYAAFLAELQTGSAQLG